MYYYYFVPDSHSIGAALMGPACDWLDVLCCHEWLCNSLQLLLLQRIIERRGKDSLSDYVRVTI
jgi:hypothetical protein